MTTSQFVIISQSWRKRTNDSPWHVLREDEASPLPMIEGLCGAETAGSAHWQVAAMWSAPGRLCPICRRALGKGERPYVAQGPAPRSTP